MKSLNTIIMIIYVHLYKLQFLLTFFLEVQTVDCVLYSYHGVVSVCQGIQIKFYVFTPLIFVIAMKCIHMEYYIIYVDYDLHRSTYCIFLYCQGKGFLSCRGGH